MAHLQCNINRHSKTNLNYLWLDLAGRGVLVLGMMLMNKIADAVLNFLTTKPETNVYTQNNPMKTLTIPIKHLATHFDPLDSL